MEIDCVSVLDQPAKGGRLREVEGEEFVVIKMARGQGVQAAPSAKERDGREERPTLGFGEMRQGDQKAHGQERARSGAKCRVRADRSTLGQHAHDGWAGPVFRALCSTPG